MAMYRKKPIVVEAWQHQVSPVRDWPEWLQHEVNLQHVIFGNSGSILIRTLEGDMHANPGDWIIKGVKGEIYPCHPDIFAATYEAAEIELPPDVAEMPPGVRADAMQPTERGDPAWRAQPIGPSGPWRDLGGDAVARPSPGLIPEDDYRHPNQRATRFRDEMQEVINSHSRENGSDTPDFILADFMLEVFNAFDKAVTKRSNWYGGDSKAELQAQLLAEARHTADDQAEIERLVGVTQMLDEQLRQAHKVIDTLEANNTMLRGDLQRVSMAGLAPSMVVGDDSPIKAG